MIGIIQIGNYQSVANAFKKLNIQTAVSLDQQTLSACDALVLPGVGEFSTVMQSIAPLAPFLRSYKKPFLGICAGMQVLLYESKESPGAKGLGVIKGKVEKFQVVRTPQIGWNKLENITSPLFEKEDYVYFVNSYYCVPKEEVTIATTYYGENFCAAVRKNNFFGVQFHPEKSGEFGLKILQNFARLTTC